MHLSLLDILRCPFCGSPFQTEQNAALDRRGDDIEWGVVGCQCCAFPIVAGIPVLIADDHTRAAMHTLEAGGRDQALVMLLGLDEGRAAAFRELLTRGDALTFSDAIALLSQDAEGTYFVYRFSDPTYVMAQALLEGLAQNQTLLQGRVLDVCGGSGHLTRLLDGFAPRGGTVLADVFFFKLWLAKRFTAPRCSPVCCDANNPLPFARAGFSMVVLSDAFPYIWHKRLLADEMMRLADTSGALVMPHLHSALGENFSPGMPLTPEGYRNLFEPLEPRLFSDRLLLDDAIARGAVDVSKPLSPSELGGQPSLTLVASHDPAIFRRYEPALIEEVRGALAVNPLYRVEVQGDTQELTLAFPTDSYEEEFGECRRYLQERLSLPRTLSPGALGGHYESLRRRRIVLDLPPHYL